MNAALCNLGGINLEVPDAAALVQDAALHHGEYNVCSCGARDNRRDGIDKRSLTRAGKIDGNYIRTLAGLKAADFIFHAKGSRTANGSKLEHGCSAQEVAAIDRAMNERCKAHFREHVGRIRCRRGIGAETNADARLQELLGGFAPVKAVQGMTDPLHYRNKAIASFAAQHGKLVCGLYAEGTHKVLPGADCLLQEDILNKTLAAVLDAARTCRWTAYDEDRGTGLLRHTVLRSSADGKVLVTLVTPGPELPGSKNFCAAMRKKAPWVVSIVQNINPTRTSAVLGNREKTLYGPGFVLDTLCGTQFAISSRSFYQVNLTQTEVLYKKALELAKLTGRETVVDAYCGIGTIGLCAAPQAKQVIGVERNPAAVKDAAANARRNKIANAHFVCADATEWMTAAAGEGLRPDVVFLDPPRAGSTPECIAAVNKMKPRRVVYVSCDPETLARDVAAFTRLGWRAAKFCPVDLFPQTRHVETVCLLVK